MSDRLYYADSYLRDFDARVVRRSRDSLTVYLDRTAFYPSSGGQPNDTGSMAGVPVLDVVDEGDAIAHRLAAPVETDVVHCSIDWPRRFDHMQQHSGQHLLSGAFIEVLGAETISFHMSAELSTIDLAVRAVEPEGVRQVEARANEIVCENRPLSVSFEEAQAAEGLRRASGRQGTLRIVSIPGLDRSACGGTHVRATGEIGPILVRKLDRVRDTVRVEFLCGLRAVRRARADYDALARAAQQFSAPLDELPGLVAGQLESARNAARGMRKLETELAGYRGRELYAATAPAADGVRRIIERLASGSLEDLRPLAQSFTASPAAVFVAVIESPPSVLLAVSEDSGINAGAVLKAALARAGGRGGGTPRMAQGSVPSPDALAGLLANLGAA